MSVLVSVIITDLNCGLIVLRRLALNRKEICKRKLTDTSSSDDLAYWLSKTPEERIEAVEFLRRQRHGSSARLQKVIRVFKRQSS